MHIDMVDWEELRTALRSSGRPATRRDAAPTVERQTVLFSGMDCLSGQQDLFETDGEAETESQGRQPGENFPLH
jgi:hypothetical protein